MGFFLCVHLSLANSCLRFLDCLHSYVSMNLVCVVLMLALCMCINYVYCVHCMCLIYSGVNGVVYLSCSAHCECLVFSGAVDASYCYVSRLCNLVLCVSLMSWVAQFCVWLSLLLMLALRCSLVVFSVAAPVVCLSSG